MGSIFGIVILMIFFLMVIKGSIVSQDQKKNQAEPERTEAEQMRNYVSTFSDDPWNSSEEPKGKVESFYDGKTSAWGNTRKIIYKEKQTMLERAKLSEQKHEE